MPERCQYNKAFTLVEMSLVLVVIGLLVGAIFVGRDLIHAAEIRAQIGQIEKYKTAVNSFKLKYNSLPGDLPASEATSYGMTARSGATGHGDGNGYIESCNAWPATNSANVFGCETALVWEDLSFANLIDGSIRTATDALTQVPTGQQSLYFPAAKLGRGNYIVAARGGSLSTTENYNYLSIGAITSTDAGGNYSLQQNITPGEAYAIDSKIDDGIPQTTSGLPSGSVYPTDCTFRDFLTVRPDRMRPGNEA